MIVYLVTYKSNVKQTPYRNTRQTGHSISSSSLGPGYPMLVHKLSMNTTHQWGFGLSRKVGIIYFSIYLLTPSRFP